MAASKKLYEALAEEIRGTLTTTRDPVAEAALNNHTRRLARILHEDNPRFNKARFLQAAGVLPSGKYSSDASIGWTDRDLVPEDA